MNRMALHKDALASGPARNADPRDSDQLIGNGNAKGWFARLWRRRKSSSDLRLEYYKGDLEAQYGFLMSLYPSDDTPDILRRAKQRLDECASFTEARQVETMLIYGTPAGTLKSKLQYQLDSGNQFARDALQAIGDAWKGFDEIQLRELYSRVVSRYNFEELRKEIAEVSARRYMTNVIWLFFAVLLIFLAGVAWLTSGSTFGEGSVIDRLTAWVTAAPAIDHGPSGKAAEVQISFFRTFSVVMFSGLLGAAFSNLVQAQRRIQASTPEDLELSHKATTIIIRLATGMAGSLILFFFYEAGMFTSDLFPDLGQINFEVIAVNNVRAGDKVSALIPNEAMSKLFIWSFVAGFSESFVPKALGKVAEGNPPPK